MVEGAVLHRYEFGAGVPLLALHGVSGTGRLFGDLAGRLSGVRVVAPDLRGHGHSLPDPPWRLEQHVADVLATVADLPRFDLLGYSFGGAVAAHLAAARPERVRSLVLLDPAVGLPPDFVLPMARASLRAETFDAPETAGRQLAATMPWLAPGEIAEHVTDDLVVGDDGRWRWRTEEAAVVTAFSETCRPVPAVPPDVPVLLVRTALNPRGSQSAAAAWADRPNVSQTTLDCSHQLLTERPVEVAALVGELLTAAS